MPYELYPNFLPRDVVTSTFARLADDLDWERRDTAPRYEYWVASKDYTYGRGIGARTYSPRPTHEDIEHINDLVSEFLEFPIPYNACFLNMYENSRDSLGWHADDDPGIDHRFGIAIVTLYEYAGKDRNISFKNIATGETETIAAAYGSLIYMPPGMQSTHLHRIPKAGFECPRRISLTYRMLKED